MEPFALSTLFAGALLASLLMKFWLATRQIRYVAAHRGTVPSAFASSISLAAHQRAADYTLAKARFGILTMAFSAAVLMGWTMLGGLDSLNAVLLGWVQPRFGDLAYQLSLLGAFVLIGGLLDLPLSLYSTFRIEQDFGFNRLTGKLFLLDLAKNTLVGLLIGAPLAAGILLIMSATGSLWWLWAWAAWAGFNLLMLVLYPTVIAPLFNKFVPLADEALKAKVLGLMARCGFSAKGLFVMDGSKRSAHANAYFTGFGASKRVVFFDTLIVKLTPSEIEAVLAHELGHFKHKHVLKRIVAMFGLSLLAFAALGWLSTQAGFYLSLGVRPSMSAANDALAIVLFLLAVPVLGFLMSPLFAHLSRKHEFEADAYAARQSDGRDLSSALLKLHEGNASTLTPDPVYARFYYSHPPASERLAALTRHASHLHSSAPHANAS